MITHNNNTCQSCGNSIYQISDFGTSRDGSVNTDYCFSCFQEGTFTDRIKSFEQKIARNINLATRLGISRTRAMKRTDVVIPNLKLWRRTKSKEEKDPIH